jgi:hypothetical protein
VHDPTLTVGRITVNRKSASALVLTGARCQQLTLANLFLVKTSGGWRIASESQGSSSRPSC